MPYNKSILTRIIAPQLHKSNLLALCHFSKNALVQHINTNKSMFLFLDKAFEKRLTKKKVNTQQALKMLQNKFPTEVKEIYEILGNFREGVQSFETYT